MKSTILSALEHGKLPGDNLGAICLWSGMVSRSRFLLNGLALLCLGALAEAEPGSLSKDELGGAVVLDSLSIPTPGESLNALSKLGKLDWSARFRPPIATNFSSRAQMAINLGGLIADGYIAVEARDSQQVKNIGKDIVNLAKPLGVQQEILNRGKSLTDFASEGKWDALKEELEATQNEAKTAMAENKDTGLVLLVTLGGWLRGTEALTGYLSEHYSADATRLLRQPGIARFFNERLEALPEKMREDSSVKKIRVKMGEIESTLSFSRDAVLSVESVKVLNQLVADLLKQVSKKDPK